MENTSRALKTWTKPQLLVLVRSNPEEAVLQNCKMVSQTAAGVNAGDGICMEICNSACVQQSSS